MTHTTLLATAALTLVWWSPAIGAPFDELTCSSPAVVRETIKSVDKARTYDVQLRATAGATPTIDKLETFSTLERDANHLLCRAIAHQDGQHQFPAALEVTYSIRPSVGAGQSGAFDVWLEHVAPAMPGISQALTCDDPKVVAALKKRVQTEIIDTAVKTEVAQFYAQQDKPLTVSDVTATGISLIHQTDLNPTTLPGDAASQALAQKYGVVACKAHVDYSYTLRQTNFLGLTVAESPAAGFRGIGYFVLTDGQDLFLSVYRLDW